MQAIQNNIILEPRSASEDEQYGDIVLKRKTDAQITQGIVHSVGDLVKNIKPGDTVMYNSFAAAGIPYGGATYLKILEQHVLGIVTT